MILLSTLGLLGLVNTVSARSLQPPPGPPGRFNRQACQALTPDPLSGCPCGTVLVGPSADHTTIQSAVRSLPNDTSTQYILIEPGDYTEQVNVTRTGPLYLLGQTNEYQSQQGNLVNVYWQAVAGTGDNAYTAVLTVAPDLEAALTGRGPTGHTVPANESFGNVDFRAYNLNFINNFTDYSDTPSLAISTGYSNAGLYYSGFFSYQDTIYIGKNGNAYFSKCTIAGQTDFFYGFGTAWVEKSDIQLRGCGGGITAWKGTNTTFANKYGIYLHDNFIHKANSTLNITQQCALGRPWNSQMRSIFSYNYLDDSIQPGGYITWTSPINNSTLLGEYQDRGPGFNITARQANYPTTLELTAEQYEPYSCPRKVFQYLAGTPGNYKWIDFDA